MTTTPRSPTPKRRRGVWLLRVLVMGGLGVVAYYGLEVADDLLMQRLAGTAAPAPIDLAELPPDLTEAARGPSEGPGNGLLRRSAYALDGRQSITATVSQDGWIDGERVATRGEYHQLGGGPDRAFLLKQTGKLAGQPTRLLRVSDSRFLWTDLTWGPDAESLQRSVSRIDLRRVRRAVKERAGAATTLDPSAWSRFGGLPMLVNGLEQAFAFGQPRHRLLRGKTVLAMVGRWRPERLDELTADGKIPPRAPQHVVIALDESTLFPVLLEYRDRRDLLSRPNLSDDDLLVPSNRPMLKMELAHVPGTPPLDQRMFAYRPNEAGWIDQTERELQLVRRGGTAVANATTSGARPR